MYMYMRAIGGVLLVSSLAMTGDGPLRPSGLPPGYLDPERFLDRDAEPPSTDRIQCNFHDDIACYLNGEAPELESLVQPPVLFSPLEEPKSAGAAEELDGSVFSEPPRLLTAKTADGEDSTPLELPFLYPYDRSRSPAGTSSAKHMLPDFPAPFHAFVQHDLAANADSSNQVKLALGLWQPFSGSGLGTPDAKVTGTVGLCRQDSWFHWREHESYGLNGGVLVNLTEGLSAGVNVSYSWGDSRPGTLFFLELKNPVRISRHTRGGFDELGNP